MTWEVTATFAILQARDNKGLDLGSDHADMEGGRPELL